MPGDRTVIMDRHLGVVYGAFFWDNWIAGNQDWEQNWTAERTTTSATSRPGRSCGHSTVGGGQRRVRG